MFNLPFNLLLFVCDVLFAVLAYNSSHYSCACILSGLAGAMFVMITVEFIDRN